MNRSRTPVLVIDMSSWNANTLIASSPAEVLERLTDPEAIARWAPVPFEVAALHGTCLRAGSHARVSVRLAGRSVEFDVDALRASRRRLELVALGPISIDVRYQLRPAGSACELEASVSVQGRGVLGPACQGDRRSAGRRCASRGARAADMRVSAGHRSVTLMSSHRQAAGCSHSRRRS
jgi:hypothetical protein